VLGPYRRILATRHLPGLLGWSLLARLHYTGTPLAMTFLVAGWTGSYGWAGVVGGALTLGMGIGGPLRGRSVDRRPAPRVLLVSGLGYAIGMILIALLPSWAWPAAPVLALLSGLVSPPAGSVARMVWAQLPDQVVREAAYAAEATLQEILYMVGPIVAAVLVSMINARAALGACAAFALLGAVGFAVMLVRAGLSGGPVDTSAAPAHRRGPSILRAPGLLPLLAMMLLVVAALTSADMVVIAWVRNRGTPGLAGVLGAVWALGSALGGLLIAGRSRGSRDGRTRLMIRAAAVTGGLALIVPVLPPITADPPPWLVGAVLMLGGSAIAPAMAVISSQLGAVAPEGRRGEVFGWQATAVTTGGAMVSPVIGAVLDHFGPAPAAGVAALLAAMAVPAARSVPATAPPQLLPVPATSQPTQPEAAS
jgi:MFS family permease